LIDIPLNMALVAVDDEKRHDGLNGCRRCFFHDTGEEGCFQTPCRAEHRKDGKNVIFKLVDLPEEKRKLIDAMREVCNEDCPNHNGTVTMGDDKITCDRCGILLLTDKLGINRIVEGIAR